MALKYTLTYNVLKPNGIGPLLTDFGFISKEPTNRKEFEKYSSEVLDEISNREKFDELILNGTFGFDECFSAMVNGIWCNEMKTHLPEILNNPNYKYNICFNTINALNVFCSDDMFRKAELYSLVGSNNFDKVFSRYPIFLVGQKNGDIEKFFKTKIEKIQDLPFFLTFIESYSITNQKEKLAIFFGVDKSYPESLAFYTYGSYITGKHEKIYFLTELDAYRGIDSFINTNFDSYVTAGQPISAQEVIDSFNDEFGFDVELFELEDNNFDELDLNSINYSTDNEAFCKLLARVYFTVYGAEIV